VLRPHRPRHTPRRWTAAAAPLLALVGLAAGSARAGSLDLPVRGWGLSFGNSRVFHGVRFNLVDDDVERLDGLTFTFWRPRDNPRAEVNGLAFGVVGPSAGRLRGVALGGFGIQAHEISGVAVAGIGIGVGGLREDDTYAFGGTGRSIGILIGGVGVGGERLGGLAIGGIGVGGNAMLGIALGGVGVGVDDLRGLAIGGIGVGGERVRGIAIGGIGMGADRFTGLGIGGLGVGADQLTGICIGGIGAGADRFTGLGIGGVGLGAERFRGIGLAGGMLRAVDFGGLGAAAYCRTTRRQEGVTIALLNIARELHGVQVGVLNWAGNNPRGLRLLPVLNAHFGE
jgi:hypothetical protein